MNDKDKEAFKIYCGKEQVLSAELLWQAACEYKQKEIDKDKILILELSIENSHYFNLIAKLQVENEKLRESLEVLRQNLKWDAGNSEIIREALKLIE